MARKKKSSELKTFNQLIYQVVIVKKEKKKEGESILK